MRWDAGDPLRGFLIQTVRRLLIYGVRDAREDPRGILGEDSPQGVSIGGGKDPGGSGEEKEGGRWGGGRGRGGGGRKLTQSTSFSGFFIGFLQGFSFKKLHFRKDSNDPMTLE